MLKRCRDPLVVNFLLFLVSKVVNGKLAVVRMGSGLGAGGTKNRKGGKQKSRSRAEPLGGLAAAFLFG